MILQCKNGTRVGVWQGRGGAVALGIDSKTQSVGMLTYELQPDELDRVIAELKHARAAMRASKNGARN